MAEPIPNGVLRARLQPILFLRLTESIGDFEVDDVVAAQYWGQGQVMLTPLPRAAAKGRVPAAFLASKLRAIIDLPE